MRISGTPCLQPTKNGKQMRSKWFEYDTSRGPVEIRVEWPSDNNEPNRLHIRRVGDKEKFVSLPTDGFLDKYRDLTEAVEHESRILYD